MSNERIWVTISRGISPELSEPVLAREVDGKLAEDEPVLVVGLRQALGRHLEKHGIFVLDGGPDEGAQ